MACIGAFFTCDVGNDYLVLSLPKLVAHIVWYHIIVKNV